MSALETVHEAWSPVPDWLHALALECDRTSQNRTAKRLDRSASLVSNVLRNRYPADLAAVEEIVRGVLMNETVPCPVLGDIGKQVCSKWRGRSRSFKNGNTHDVTMYRACNRCPRNGEVEP